jgi:hypothetical protein
MNSSTPIFFVLFPRVDPLFRSRKSRSYIRKLIAAAISSTSL